MTIDYDADDQTLESLDKEQLQKGKDKDMATIAEFDTHDIIEEKDHKGEVVDGMWVVNGKDDGSVRARIVARQFRKKWRDSRFAATPGMLPTRLLLSRCASSRRYCFVILDLRGALLQIPSSENVAMHPPSDVSPGPGKVWLLKVAW